MTLLSDNRKGAAPFRERVLGYLAGHTPQGDKDEYCALAADYVKLDQI